MFHFIYMGHGPLSCMGRHLFLMQWLKSLRAKSVSTSLCMQITDRYWQLVFRRGRNCAGYYRIQPQLGMGEIGMFQLQEYYARLYANPFGSLPLQKSLEGHLTSVAFHYGCANVFEDVWAWNVLGLLPFTTLGKTGSSCLTRLVMGLLHA